MAQLTGIWGEANQRLGFDVWSENPVQISGTLHGVPMRLGDDVRGDKVKTIYLVASARHPTTLDLGLLVRPTGFVQQIAKLFGGGKDVAVGDEFFDEAYDIHGDDPARVRALLEPSVRRAIGLLGKNDFQLTDNGLMYEQVFSPTNADTIISLAERVASVIGAVRAASSAVSLPQTIAPHLEAWRAWADENGLELSPAPLAVSGRLESGSFSAVIRRADADHYVVDLTLHFEPPLTDDLQVRAASRFDYFGRMFAPHKVKTGDPHFDETFVVCSGQPDLVRARLDVETRATLIGLQEAGDLELSGRSLSVHVPLPKDPRELAPVIARLHALARKIAEGLRGAYR
jgi:hypothetical protein